MADPETPDRAIAAHRLSSARLFGIVLAFLLVAGYAVWKSDRFQSLVHGISQARLSGALGVPVSFDTVDLSFFPPSILLANVRIANDPRLGLPADRPLLEAEEVSIGGGVSLVGSRLRLGRIRALRPRVHVIQSLDGTFNVPPGLLGPSRGGLQVSIGSVLVQQGVLDFEGRKARVDGRFDDFMAELSRVSPETYRGTFAARRASLRLPQSEPLAMSLTAHFLLAARTGVVFEDLHAAGPFGEIDASGAVETARGGSVVFAGTGRIAIEEIERIFHSRLGFSGSATVQARVEVPPQGGFRIAGVLQSRRVQRDRFVFEDVTARVAARPESLLAQIEQAGYCGGRATAVLRIANLVGRSQPMTLAVEGRDISVERFFADLGIAGTGLSGDASLSAALRWADGGIERADGGGTLAISATTASSLVRERFGVPVSGGGPFSIAGGKIRFAGDSFRFHDSTIDLDGGFRIGQWIPDFDLRIQTRDASELDRLFQNFTAATGGKSAPLGLGGSGQIQGHFSGDWGNPDASVQIAMEDSRFSNVSFGSVRGSVEMHDGAFFFRPLHVYDGEATLSLEGMARYRVDPGRPRFDLSLAARGYPLSRLLEYLDLQFPVEGRITGAFPVAGTPEQLTGGGAVELADAVVWGQKVPFVRANVRFTPGRFALEDVSAEVGGGMVRGSGAFSIKEKTFEARAAGDKISLAAVQAAQELGSDISGKLSFQFSGEGSTERPDMTVSASLSDAQFFGRPVPEPFEPRADLAVRRGVLDGTVGVREHWSLKMRGDVFGSPPRVELALDAPDLASLLFLTPLDLPPGHGGSLAAEGSLTLPSQAGESPTGDVTVTRARLDLPDRPGVLAASGPVHLKLADGQLTIPEFSLGGESTSLKASGQIGLQGSPRRLALAASGTLDASAVALLIPDLTLSGKLQVDARASGTLDKPVLSGSIRMQNGRYRLTGLGQILDEVEGSITFHESRGDLEGHAKFGGGSLFAGGGFSVEGLSLKDFRVSIQGRKVRLPQFQDFRLIADLDLVVTGGPAGNTVRGEVVLLRGTYSKDFDITLADLVARGRPAAAAVAEPWKTRTTLEVRIVSSESLEVRNNVARLTGTVDLVARGTVAEPTLLGQIVFDEGGRLTFRSVRYDIESGTVTFANARGFAPILDLRARAEVKGYDLVVSLVGTWPRIQATFSSDPPLPDETILGLLLTGSAPVDANGDGHDRLDRLRRRGDRRGRGHGRHHAGHAAHPEARAIRDRPCLYGRTADRRALDDRETDHARHPVHVLAVLRDQQTAHRRSRMARVQYRHRSRAARRERRLSDRCPSAAAILRRVPNSSQVRR